MDSRTLIGLLPLLVLALAVRAGRNRCGSWLEAAVCGGIYWALAAVALTEALSLFHAVERAPLILGWSGAGVVALLLTQRHKAAVMASAAAARPGDRFAVPVLAVLALAAVASVVALGALAPPNTWDAMTYHLPRVEHWRQAGTLAHYPTPIPRQLVSGPLAEILILHLRILSEGDRTANLIQGLALAGCVLAAAGTARQLGATAAGQTLAALFVATLPIAILEGSGCQNDLVVAFFLIAAAERLLAWRAHGDVVAALGAGGALGLAVLAKGTGWFFAAGLGLLVVATILTRRRMRDVALAVLMAALALAVNAGHFARNQATFGTPLGPQFGVANEDPGAGGLASNLVRGMVSNLATPVTDLNDALVEAVAFGHKVLGADADAPATTFPETRFGLSRSVLDENLAPNPLHLVLVVMTVGGVLRALARRRPGAPVLYVAAVVAGGLLFCLLLRWQPWITRLQLPFFVLMAPAAGWLLTAGLPRARPLAWGTLLVVAALPWLTANQARPWFAGPVRQLASRVAPDIGDADRWTLMFWMRPALLPAYRDALILTSERARAGGGLGLVVGGDTWEYPLWALAARDGGYRIEHICQQVEPTDFHPPVVLLIERPALPELNCVNRTYVPEATFKTPGDPAGDAGVTVYRLK